MAEGVQIYGAFDVGVLVRGGNDTALAAAARTTSGGTESTVASGMNGHNGIGFRVSEDLGNGMKLGGDAMFGFALDSGSAGSATGGTFNAIYSYLSLSGDFGTLIAGRAGGARAGWLKKYDPFGGFGVGGQLAVHNSRLGNADYADNVLAWITPEVLPGLKGLFAYTSNLVGQDQANRDNGATPLYAIAAMYDSGPLSFVVNYEKLWLYNNYIGRDNTHVITFGSSYDFGVAKVFAAYDQLTNATNGWQIGASAPVSEALTLKAGYARSEVRGGTDAAAAQDAECGKISVGGVYTMSKRTNLYADYARLTSLDARSNCAGGITTYGGSFANSAGGRDNGVGYGEWGMNVGLRHTF
jgi:predicted porin